MLLEKINTIEQIKINNLQVKCFQMPASSEESDGTLIWEKTVLVWVEITAGSETGRGYTFADISTAKFIHVHLSKLLINENAFDIEGIWNKLIGETRNLGRPGVTSMAISATDAALWDLKARLLKLPLVKLLGQVYEKIPVYGSGGFTSYDRKQFENQFTGWLNKGIGMFKMKIGRNKRDDIKRICHARQLIGDEKQLFVDANGSYFPREAAGMADEISQFNISWFEEPVTSDNLPGLHFVKEHTPGAMNITAGEYGYDLTYFNRMLQAEAVDVLQADATRCTGITGFIKVGILCEAYHIPLSAHTSPALHLHPCCALKNVVHIEYFHDHERIENMLFDNPPQPLNGFLVPDLQKPGTGLELKEKDIEKYKIN